MTPTMSNVTTQAKSFSQDCSFMSFFLWDKILILMTYTCLTDFKDSNISVLTVGCDK